MNYRYGLPLLFLIIGWVCATEPADARTFAADPNQPDTIRVDSVRALRGSHLAVPVYISQDEPLNGIEITLKHSSPSIHLDSFSFQGSIVQQHELRGAAIYDSIVIAYVFPTSEFYIYPWRGLFGRLYLTISATAQPELVKLDSTTLVVDAVEHGNWFTDLQF